MTAVTDVPRTPAPPDAGARRNPYVGPRAFGVGEALFGRDAETDALTDLLVSGRIVLLHSQSGAGKTSLLHANLIPRLTAEGFEILPTMRVGGVPVGAPPSANRYVLSVLDDLENSCKVPGQHEALLGHTLDSYLAKRARHNAEAPELLIFDQFEELLTLDPTDLEAKREFCRQVGIALKSRSRWAIFAMREEFCGALDPFLDLLPTRLANRYRLQLLSPEAARACIERPARAAGVTFMPAAVDELVKDLRQVQVQVSDGTVPVSKDGPFIEPVQLQVVCLRLWDNLPPGTMVVSPRGDARNAPARAHDVDEALGEYYAAAVERAAADGQCDERDVRRWIESGLVVNRMRAQALQGSEAAHRVSAAAVKVLEDVYLLRREERRGGIWYELAHDRLVLPLLENNQAWRERSFDDMEKAAARWLEAGRPDKLLANAFGSASTRSGDLVPGGPDILRTLSRLKARIREGHKLSPEVAEYLSASRRRMMRQVASVYGTMAVVFLAILAAQQYRARRHLQADNVAAVAISDSLRVVVDSLKRLRETVYEQVWGLEKTTPQVVRLSVAADQALQTASKAATTTNRGAITVEYFFKRRDPARVEFALRELGYQVKVQPARAEDIATNAISFGNGVPLADVSIIALAVIRSGADLRRICPFRNPDGRQYTVQVLGSETAARLPSIDLKQLQSVSTGSSLPCAEGAAMAR